MRLARLKLKNFRGFDDLDLVLSSGQTTLLVGKNACGKSSILEAVSILLTCVTQPSAAESLLRPSDIRVGCTTAELCLELVHAPARAHWSLRAHYSAESKLQVTLDGPDGASRPGFTHLYLPVDRKDNERTLLEWYQRRSALERAEARDDRGHLDLELDAVRQSMQVFLSGISTQGTEHQRGVGEGGDDYPPSLPRFMKGEDRLELCQLSRGEQALVMLGGCIAHRFVSPGAQWQELRLGEGIVLVDEIDLHLHPEWQREIVPQMEHEFPNVQFILTTHSPLVISELEHESVRMLEGHKLVENTPPTCGRDSNSILNDIMGVAERPSRTRERIARAEHLRVSGRWDEAQAEVDELKHDLGEDDPEVARLDTLVSFRLSNDVTVLGSAKS